MSDDDKRPDFERLDETRPERNERSIFNWLRGKEQTDEEKLRKKLDEDLKQAARNRAEQFEEERRQEESREVAETRKLKKRWRAKLVEKSRKMLESASDNESEPLSGYEIAKLMVAERIVKLNDILETEDLRKSEMKAIKIHIDFMGLLSEKLDKPELEVPEEVEQLYQTIASSVAEAVNETKTAAPLEAASPVETPPLSEAETAYTTFAMHIVQAIQKTLRRSSESSPTNGGVSEPELTSPAAQEKPSPPVRQQAESLRSIIESVALPVEAIRQDIQRDTSVRHLAEIVKNAEMITAEATMPEKAKAGVSVESFNTTLAPPEKSYFDAERVSSPAAESLVPELPKKSIKYWSEFELLKKAEDVALGSGLYLAEAYRRGDIDREALVKILESFDKGRDYRREFISKRASRRRKLEDSPEFLSQKPKPYAAPQMSPYQNIEKDDSSIGDFHTPNVPENVSPPKKTKPINMSHLRNIAKTLPTFSRTSQEARRIARDISDRITRKQRVTMLFMSILMVLIIFATVMTLIGS